MNGENGKRRVGQVVFRKDNERPLIYTHGAWGGPTPRGDIVVHFYQDYLEPPDAVDLVETDEGIAEDQGPAGLPRFNRAVVAKVVMTPEVALSVARWLEQKVKLLMDQAAAGSTNNPCL